MVSQLATTGPIGAVRPAPIGKRSQLENPVGWDTR